jgi:PAS domain-containing protein
VLEGLAQSARPELELRAELEELQRLRGLFETAPVAISASDLEGRSLLRNPAAAQLGADKPLNVLEFPLTDLTGEAYGTGAIGVPEAPQRFVHAFDDAPTGMAMIGTDGRFRLVNAALCKLLGRTEAELLQRTLAKTIHP